MQKYSQKTNYTSGRNKEIGIKQSQETKARGTRIK
jgi:hypothetical protein